MTNNKYKYFVLNHIPRCGGSSLRQSFYEASRNNDYFTQYPIYISNFTHNNICLYENTHLIEAIHPDTIMFIDHSINHFIEDAFHLDSDIVYRALTLRNPIDRIISHIHYFYKKHIDTLPQIVLTQYLNQFGNMTIQYLTNYKHYHKNLADKYKIAKEELENYNFIFMLENQKLGEIFTDTNPFGLRLPNYHNNKSPIDTTLTVSAKTKNIIYQHINLEIKLLESFYEMDI